jgi:hypothetical protein
MASCSPNGIVVALLVASSALLALNTASLAVDPGLAPSLGNKSAAAKPLPARTHSQASPLIPPATPFGQESTLGEPPTPYGPLPLQTQLLPLNPPATGSQPTKPKVSSGM